MLEILMQFFRFVFICYLFYIAFIVCKAVFDVVVVAVEYYCFGKKPTPAKRTDNKEKETEIWYNDWD